MKMDKSESTHHVPLINKRKLEIDASSVKFY